MKETFHLPDGLITGDAPYVGVLYLPSQTWDCPAIRLFFPATLIDPYATPKKADYYIDRTRVSYVLEGLAHIAMVPHDTSIFRFIIRPIIWILMFFIPVRYLPHTALVTDDSTVQYLPPSALKLNQGSNTKQRLVIFSHGLTGTGEENSIFCTALAKKGYVVASVLHRDGSASIAQLPDGSWKYHANIPLWCATRKYCEQIQIRANEVLDACDWLLNLSGDKNNSDNMIQLKNHPPLKEICSNLDGRNVIISGISYGAATSVLAATKRPDQFQCALLLDGWFNLGNVSDDKINFPPDAYSSCAHVGFGIPSLFIGSADFKAWTDCYNATCQLANQIPDNCYEMHYVPDTRHLNFIDLTFWIPKWVLAKYPRHFDVGNANGYEVHEMVITWTCQFLDKYFQDK